MRFVAPCGHEGVPVTPNFVTCLVCDRVPAVTPSTPTLKLQTLTEYRHEMLSGIKPPVTAPALTWKTREQFRDELAMAISHAFGGSMPTGPSSLCWRLAEDQSRLLYELQEFVRSAFPESFL